MGNNSSTTNNSYIPALYSYWYSITASFYGDVHIMYGSLDGTKWYKMVQNGTEW